MINNIIVIASIITVYFGINLLLLMLACGIILKQVSLFRKGKDPSKIVDIKLPKTQGQRIKEGLEREERMKKFMSRG